jgi:hypothetical protein
VKIRRKVLAVRKHTSAVSTFLCALAVTSIAASSQVKVSIPSDNYKAHDLIDVAIENQTNAAISFCVELGHWSFRAKGSATQRETTPTPVYVQARGKRGWSMLLIGPDIGSMRHSVWLAAGESQHYPFRLSDPGQMRIVLDYWEGENDNTCANPKDRKRVSSRVIWVR